jgi:hypothetical protein
VIIHRAIFLLRGTRSRQLADRAIGSARHRPLDTGMPVSRIHVIRPKAADVASDEVRSFVYPAQIFD